MGRGLLSENEIKLLLENPNVLEVNSNRIIYKDEFKEHFMKEYHAGKGPRRIFREAGFDLEILGSKRVETAAARWKESYKANSLGKYKDGYIARNDKEQPLRKQIALLEQETAMLKKQVSMLCKICNLENVTE